MDYQTKNIGLEAAASDSQLAPVHDYWQLIRRENSIPALTDMDMMDLPLKLVPWCSVVDVTSGEQEFVIRFWGTERVVLHGVDYTGQSISELRPPAVREKVLSEFSVVAETGRPALFETMLSAEPNTRKQPTYYRMLRLPFGEEGNVSAILSVPSFRENRKLVYDWFGSEPPIAVLTSQTPA